MYNSCTESLTRLFPSPRDGAERGSLSVSLFCSLSPCLEQFLIPSVSLCCSSDTSSPSSAASQTTSRRNSEAFVFLFFSLLLPRPSSSHSSPATTQHVIHTLQHLPSLLLRPPASLALLLERPSARGILAACESSPFASEEELIADVREGRPRSYTPIDCHHISARKERGGLVKWRRLSLCCRMVSCPISQSPTQLAHTMDGQRGEEGSTTALGSALLPL